jgi:hypothetical protein
MPTKHRRHAITETPRVKAALDRLRDELGTTRLDLGELVVLGADIKLWELRSERGKDEELRHRLAHRVRTRTVPVSLNAAEEVRQTGWVRR